MPSLVSQLLAQGSATGYAYTRPFLQPLPVWDYWVLLLIPLVVCISVVYKAIKCSHVSEVPRAAIVMSLWIIVAFAGAALGLLGVVRVMQ